jgi:AcrR family transcriptional regulator
MKPLSNHPPERDWILIGMAESCAARGYEATSVDDVCAAAGVTRDCFERTFASKAECLGATMELIVEEGRKRLATASVGERSWEARLRAGVPALLDFLAERSAFTRVALLEAAPAGGRAAILYRSAKASLLAELESGPDRTGAGIPASAGRGALAGVEALVTSRVAAGKAMELKQLAGEVVYLLAVPYLGRREAQGLAVGTVERPRLRGRPHLRAVA